MRTGLSTGAIQFSVRTTLPFKDQKSANFVRRELHDFGKKIGHVLQPVFTSKKFSEDLKVMKTKPSLVTAMRCI